MSDATVFQTLANTSTLWMPAVSFIVGHAAATEKGYKLVKSLQGKLKGMRDPKTANAFREAFNRAIEKYEKERGDTLEAQAVAKILLHVAENDTTALEKADILQLIFEPEVNLGRISEIVARYAFAFDGSVVDHTAVAGELRVLVSDYLRPSFFQSEIFAERIGFNEVIRLLNELIDLHDENVDLDSLRQDYYQRMETLYKSITIKGISPKVQNRIIGIPMKDAFIPLEFNADNTRSKSPVTTSWDLSRPFTVRLAEEFLIIDTKFQETVSEFLDIQFPELTWLKKYEVIQDEILKHYSEKTLKEFMSKAAFNFENLSQISALAFIKRCVIQGDPGSGKSTLTRYLAWHMSANPREFVPVRIQASDFGDALLKDKDLSFEKYLLKDAGRFEPLVRHTLFSGTTFILVDDLDEVKTIPLRNSVKSKIDEFIADPAFEDNRIVLTTRIVGYEKDGITGTFPHFVVKELTNTQIEAFITQWYKAIHSEMPGDVDVETETSQLLAAITSNNGIQQMARNPLLLTIIALMKWQVRTLPERRVRLYEVATETLIQSWPQTHRNIDLEEHFVREWLAPIAFHMLSSETSSLIDEYLLFDLLVDTMLELKPMTKIEAKQKTENLLNTLSEHSGILLLRGSDDDGHEVYGFLHQTFAEYLAAIHLSGLWKDNELELLEYAHNPYWREVLLLTAGNLGTQRSKDAGKLVEQILNMGSSEYEDLIHRDLFLALAILADGVGVGIPALVEEIIETALKLWDTTQIGALRSDLIELLSKLGNTEYAQVAARIAVELNLPFVTIQQLSNILGNKHFSEYFSEVAADTDDIDMFLTSYRNIIPNDQMLDDRLFTILETGNGLQRINALSCISLNGLEFDPQLILQFAKELDNPFGIETLAEVALGISFDLFVDLLSILERKPFESLQWHVISALENTITSIEEGHIPEVIKFLFAHEWGYGLAKLARANSFAREEVFRKATSGDLKDRITSIHIRKELGDASAVDLALNLFEENFEDTVELFKSFHIFDFPEDHQRHLIQESFSYLHRNSNQDLGGLIIERLSELNTDEVRVHLEDLLTHPIEEIRFYAARQLIRNYADDSSTETPKVMIEIYHSTDDPFRRFEIAFALLQLEEYKSTGKNFLLNILRFSPNGQKLGILKYAFTFEGLFDKSDWSMIREMFSDGDAELNTALFGSFFRPDYHSGNTSTLIEFLNETGEEDTVSVLLLTYFLSNIDTEIAFNAVHSLLPDLIQIYTTNKSSLASGFGTLCYNFINRYITPEGNVIFHERK